MKTLIEEIRDLDHDIGDLLSKKTKRPANIKNLTQVRIIDFLVKNRGKNIYQIDICEALKMKKSSITEQLDSLEKDDMIVRLPDENDKRRNLISLSCKSEKNLEELTRDLSKINDEMIIGIQKKDLECFLTVIRQMEKNLERVKLNETDI